MFVKYYAPVIWLCLYKYNGWRGVTLIKLIRLFLKVSPVIYLLVPISLPNIEALAQKNNNKKPAGILYKSIAGRYRPVSYPDGPITGRYRFIKNAYWEDLLRYLVHMV